MKLEPKRYKLKLMGDEIQSELKAHVMEFLKVQREFIESLIKIREAKGLSQADVGQLLGLSQSAVAQFEKYDSNPTMGSIRRYAMVFGASISMDAEPRIAE